MNTPHKYANVIKAWADGKPFQIRAPHDKWRDYTAAAMPPFNCPSFEWRVKLVHQEAHEHYCNGGDVICRFKTGHKTYRLVWKASDATEDSKTDPRWNHPNYEFTILPKPDVRYMRAWPDFINGDLSASGAWKGENGDNNLKLTFEGEKLVKAEVIG